MPNGYSRLFYDAEVADSLPRYRLAGLDFYQVDRAIENHGILVLEHSTYNPMSYAGQLNMLRSVREKLVAPVFMSVRCEQQPYYNDGMDMYMAGVILAVVYDENRWIEFDTDLSQPGDHYLRLRTMLQEEAEVGVIAPYSAWTAYSVFVRNTQEGLRGHLHDLERGLRLEEEA